METTPRRQCLRATIGALLLGCLALASADGSQTLTNRDDPAVAELEGTYRRYLNSGRAGDVPGFHAVMTAQAQKDTASATAEVVRGLTRDDLEPTKAAFVRADIGKDRARLIYSKSLADRTRWQGVAFSKERAGWRISAIVETIDPKNVPSEARKMLGKVGLDELLSHRRMQLAGP